MEDSTTVAKRRPPIPLPLRFFFRHIELILILTLVAVATVQFALRPQSQSFDEVIESGVLRVLITDEPDSQYVFNKQHYGFEYELLAAFARSLDVELELIVVPYGELMTRIEQGVAELAIGGIINTPYVRNVSQPTIPWFEARTTVVYKRSSKRPRNIDDLRASNIRASARYFGLETLQDLSLTDDYRSEYQLLSAVNSGETRFALTTNYRAKNAKHYLANLNRSFILPQNVDLVWVLPKQHDPVLLAVLNQFLQLAMESQLPSILSEYYLGLPVLLDVVDTMVLHRKIDQLLPEFEILFRRAGRRHGVDWTLLAAMAYQESAWSNAARSPTGVRGLMQLTSATAEYLGVEDRLDVEESIDGAARYIKDLRRRLPKDIKEPERTWFAVGAYNVGLGHVRQAYRKARTRKLERTQWNTIRQLLPTLYGRRFRAGEQAKDYVERVQIFTDILRFHELHHQNSSDDTALTKSI